MAKRAHGDVMDMASDQPGHDRLLIVAVMESFPGPAAYQILDVDPISGARVPLAISFPSYVEAEVMRQALSIG
jgi:hypothetical protein